MLQILQFQTKLRCINTTGRTSSPFPHLSSGHDFQNGLVQSPDSRWQREALDSPVVPTTIRGSQANSPPSRSSTPKLPRSPMYPPMVQPRRSRSFTSTSRVSNLQSDPTESQFTDQAGRNAMHTTKPLPPEPQEPVKRSPQDDYKQGKVNNKRVSRLPWRARHAKSNSSGGNVPGGYASHYAQRFTEHFQDSLFRRPSPAMNEQTSALPSNTPDHSQVPSIHEPAASIGGQSDSLAPTISNTNNSSHSQAPGRLNSNRKGLVRKLTTRMQRKSAKKSQIGDNLDKKLVL